eukprot:IDg22853t1
MTWSVPKCTVLAPTPMHSVIELAESPLKVARRATYLGVSLTPHGNRRHPLQGTPQGGKEESCAAADD